MEPTLILGLPPSAWLLLVASFGLGLGIELLFLRARNGSRRSRAED